MKSMNKKGILAVAAVLLLAAVLFVGAAAGADVSTAAELKNAVGQGGEIKLTGDITLTETLKINTPVTLDLNGYVLRGKSSSYDDQYVLISVSSELTLNDSKGNTNPKYFRYTKIDDPYSSWKYRWTYDASADPGGDGVVILPIESFSKKTADDELAAGKTVYISSAGGAITSNDTDANKTMGVTIKSGGKFTMNDGAVIGFYTGGKTGSANPAGVSVESGAKFIMNGGYISGNVGTHGSAVVVKGTATLDGGTISGNLATRGAGVELTDADAEFEMKSGLITDNFASAGGAGISNIGGKKLLITGGEIKNCSTGSGSGSTPTGGAAVFCNWQALTVEITGGKIGENCTLGSGHRGAAVLSIDNTGTGTERTFGETAVFVTDVCLSGSKATAENTHVTGGSFASIDVYSGSLKSAKFISGGIFASAPDNKWLAEGCACVANTDEATKATYPYRVAQAVTVTFDENGGDTEAIPASIPEGVGGYYILPTTNPTRAGYTFAGWFTEATGGTEVTAATKVERTDAHTLYAHWGEKYTVTFDVQGHGIAPSSQTVNYGETVSPPEDPKAVGYLFGGWYTDSGCAEGTEWDFSTPVYKNTTLYAKWTLNFYVAKLDNYTFGGSTLPDPYIDPEGPADVTFFYSSSADGAEIPWANITTTTLSAGTWYIGANDNTDTGFDIHRSTFTVAKAEQNAPSFSANAVEDGIQISISGFDREKTYYYSVEKSGEKWMIASEQSITVSGLDAVTPYLVKVKVGAKGNYNESPAAEQTVTTGSSFSVSYNANGGVGSIPSQTGYTDKPVIVSSAKGISREGFDFTTWNTQPDGNGTSYAEEAPIETGAVLYAQWKAQTYTVSFDGNGGTADPASLEVTHGTTVNLSQVKATHNGNQVHVGWAKSPGAKSALYTPDQKVQNLGAVTLYAVWMPEAKVCHDLSVEVEDGVYVELRQGSSVIDYATSSGGQVIFGAIPEGTYNLVAIKDKGTDREKTVTREVSLTKDTDLEGIAFPEEDVNSKVVIKDAEAETGAPATPAIVVGSVDAEAKSNAEDGKFVTVTVSVTTTTPAEVTPESTLAEQEVQQDIIKIQAEAKSKGIMEQQYLGITVTKTVKESGAADKESKLTSTENKLEFIIPYDFTGKPTVTLFRCHDGVATELTPLSKRPSVEDRRDGTYFLDRSSDMIYLYASEFSTYSIAYSTEAPKPVSHGSSSSGTSVWATAAPTTAPTPVETPGAVETPSVQQPVVQPPAGQQSGSAATPAPFVGILAGLGAAAVLFGLRRK